MLALHPRPHNTRINRPGDLPEALRKGTSQLDVPIYLGRKPIALLQFWWNQNRGKAPVWVRDLGARTQA